MSSFAPATGLINVNDHPASSLKQSESSMHLCIIHTALAMVETLPGHQLIWDGMWQPAKVPGEMPEKRH